MGFKEPILWVDGQGGFWLTRTRLKLVFRPESSVIYSQNLPAKVQGDTKFEAMTGAHVESAGDMLVFFLDGNSTANRKARFQAPVAARGRRWSAASGSRHLLLRQHH
jgi:hypothetical protein